MYRNLRAEMVRLNMNGKELSKVLGITECNFSRKMNGKSPFSLSDAFKIKAALRTRLSIDKLFENGGE